MSEDGVFVVLETTSIAINVVAHGLHIFFCSSSDSDRKTMHSHYDISLNHKIFSEALEKNKSIA